MMYYDILTQKACDGSHWHRESLTVDNERGKTSTMQVLKMMAHRCAAEGAKFVPLSPLMREALQNPPGVRNYRQI